MDRRAGRGVGGRAPTAGHAIPPARRWRKSSAASTRARIWWTRGADEAALDRLVATAERRGVSEAEQIAKQYATDVNLQARIDLHERFSTSTLSYPHGSSTATTSALKLTCSSLAVGNGLMWRENRDRIPPGWRLTLTDLSPGMVDAVRATLGDRAEYAVADAESLPFRRRVVRRGDRQPHALSRREPPARVRRDRPRSRPGGVLRATTIGREHLRRLRELVPPREGGQWEKTRERFTIEQVPGELAPFFVDVELEPYEDSLEVTELEPAPGLRALARRCARRQTLEPPAPSRPKRRSPRAAPSTSTRRQRECAARKP